MDAALEQLIDPNRQLFCRQHRSNGEGEARHGNPKAANCWLVRVSCVQRFGVPGQYVVRGSMQVLVA